MRRARFLDPRELDEALRAPASDAANIPFSELPARMHELPKRPEPVRVIDCGEAAELAAAWLRQGGREVERVPFLASEAPYRPARLWSPHPWVEEVAGKIAPGLAVDLGAGLGRDAIFLASLGWRVIAVEHLPEAVERARLSTRRLLGEEADRIDWRCERAEDFTPPTSFDLLLSIRFFDQEVVASCAHRLSPGGFAIVEAYSEDHRRRTGVPKNPALAADEERLRGVFPNFSFEEIRVVGSEGREMIRVVARRREENGANDGL